MTLVLVAFGVGLVAGVAGTVYAAKRGWITPSAVELL